MGRSKGGINISHSKEEKLALVLRNLAGETTASLGQESGIYPAQIPCANVLCHIGHGCQASGMANLVQNAIKLIGYGNTRGSIRSKAIQRCRNNGIGH